LWTYYPLDGLMNGGESIASRCPTAGALRLSTHLSNLMPIHLVGLRRSLVRHKKRDAMAMCGTMCRVIAFGEWKHRAIGQALFSEFILHDFKMQ
jgi:hypothetical protein